VLALPLTVSAVDEQACFGAALLAGLGTGRYGSYHEAAEIVPKPVRMVEPDGEHTERYEEYYAKWRGR
jgi:xylulokinase